MISKRRNEKKSYCFIFPVKVNNDAHLYFPMQFPYMNTNGKACNKAA